MAGTTLGYLKFVLGFDTVAFRKGMTEAEKDLVRLQKKMEKHGKGIADLGKNLAIGITAPLAAFSAISFKAASDANELQSAFNVTFGKMSADMNKWAEETGNAMGRSTQTIQTAANTFGIFFNTAVDPAKAAEMSKIFAVLAQDLGSFFNIDPSVAMEKLRAGLSGEAEPLRAFGVFLNEAQVKAKGLELGLIKAGGTMTDQQKIVARYNLILEATTKAQGDVGRTSGSTANQLVRSKEAWNELAVVVGNKLLPIFTPMIEKLASAFEWFTKLTPATQNLVLGLAAVAAATGPVLYLVGNFIKLMAGFKVVALFTQGLLGLAAAEGVAATGAVAAGIAFRTMLPPLLIITAALATGYAAWKNWEKITQIVAAVHSAVTSYLGPALTKTIMALLTPIRLVYQAFNGLMNLIGKPAAAAKPNMITDVATGFAQLKYEFSQTAEAAPKVETGIAKVGKAAKAAKPEVDKLAEAGKQLYLHLYPEKERQLKFDEDVKALKALKLSADDAADAMARLQDERAQEDSDARKELARKQGIDTGPTLPDWLSQTETLGLDSTNPITGSIIEPMDEMVAYSAKSMKVIGDLTGQKTAEMTKAWGEMASQAITDMKGMVDAFKSGDILGGIQQLLDAILNVVKSLQGIGYFGGTGAAGKSGGFASGARSGFGGALARGGPVVPGKTYMVGENGPEWFSTRRKGFVSPNGKEAQPQRVVVVPSPYFDVVVDSRASKVAAPMAGQAAVIGVTGSEARMVRRSRRNLLAA